MTDLTGKTALITGASRGIGAAVAKAYAKAGAHVILLARTVGGLEEIDDAIRAEGGKATLMPVDLLKLDELDALGPTIYNHFGGLDIFVANAGMLGTLCPLPHAKPAEFEKVMNTNVMANFRLLRTLDPLLQQSQAGRVVFVSTSERSSTARAYWSMYAASKAAVEAMFRSYALEVEQTKVKVNGVRPGSVDTMMLASAFPGGFQGDNLKQPEDIVDVFLELAAAQCPYHNEMIDAEKHLAAKAA